MTNLESIKLYRDILRASRKFIWTNPQGELWSSIIKINARKEFEQARFERDTLIVARLLFVGRDCLNTTLEKLSVTNNIIQSNIDKTKNK